MALSSNLTMSSIPILLLAFSGLLISVEGSAFQATNNCGFDFTVFIMDPTNGVRQGAVQSHTTVLLEGIPTPSWVGGVMWVSATADPDYSKATQLDFNIANPQSPTLDFYTISTKSGFNLPASISVIEAAGGEQCGSVTSPNTDNLVYSCATGSTYSLTWC